MEQDRILLTSDSFEQAQKSRLFFEKNVLSIAEDRFLGDGALLVNVDTHETLELRQLLFRHKLSARPKFIHEGDVLRLYHTYFRRDKAHDPNIYADWKVVGEDGTTWRHCWTYTLELVQEVLCGKVSTLHAGRRMEINDYQEAVEILSTEDPRGADALNAALDRYREKTYAEWHQAFGRKKRIGGDADDPSIL